jgi:hypothetical protein
LSRDVAGIVLVSCQETAPFLSLDDASLRDLSEVPIITINQNAASHILAASGYRPGEVLDNWRSGKNPKSKELIVTLHLTLQGSFDRVETDHFDFLFRGEAIPRESILGLANTNEESLQFIKSFFETVGSEWKKIPTVYFRDFDSKLFYTRHWGRGLSSEEGVFMVYDPQSSDIGLAVHENTHSFMSQNWGGSSSFLSEGIATHLEVTATDKDRANRETLGFFRDGALLPLEKMVELDIGSDEAEAKIAYPASGSFVGFLIAEDGLDKLIEKWTGRSWEEVYGKSLNELEKAWLDWLKDWGNR